MKCGLFIGLGLDGVYCSLKMYYLDTYFLHFGGYGF